MKAVNVIYIANTSVSENLSRKDMLAWVNRCLGINLTKVEEMCSGCYYLQFMDLLFPKTVPLQKVKFNTCVEYDFITNLKLLQDSFNELGVKRTIEIEKIIKGRYQDNWEFLQWFKRFADANNCEEKAANYVKPTVLKNSTKPKKKKTDLLTNSTDQKECVKGKLQEKPEVLYKEIAVKPVKPVDLNSPIYTVKDDNISIAKAIKPTALKNIHKPQQKMEFISIDLNERSDCIKGKPEMSSPVDYQPNSILLNQDPIITGNPENSLVIYQNKVDCVPPKDVLKVDDRIQSLLSRSEDYLLNEDGSLKGQLKISSPYQLNSSIMDKNNNDLLPHNLVFGTDERIQGLRLRPEDWTPNREQTLKENLISNQPQNIVLGANERAQILQWLPIDYITNKERRVAVWTDGSAKYRYAYGIQVDNHSTSDVKRQRDLYYHKIRFIEYLCLTECNYCGVDQILNIIYSLNEKIEELNKLYDY